MILHYSKFPKKSDNVEQTMDELWNCIATKVISLKCPIFRQRVTYGNLVLKNESFYIVVTLDVLLQIPVK